jgi:hypothetical protein
MSIKESVPVSGEAAPGGTAGTLIRDVVSVCLGSYHGGGVEDGRATPDPQEPHRTVRVVRSGLHGPYVIRAVRRQTAAHCTRALVRFR